MKPIRKVTKEFLHTQRLLQYHKDTIILFEEFEVGVGYSFLMGDFKRTIVNKNRIRFPLQSYKDYPNMFIGKGLLLYLDMPREPYLSQITRAIKYCGKNRENQLLFAFKRSESSQDEWFLKVDVTKNPMGKNSRYEYYDVILDSTNWIKLPTKIRRIENVYFE